MTLFQEVWAKKERENVDIDFFTNSKFHPDSSKPQQMHQELLKFPSEQSGIYTVAACRQTSQAGCFSSLYFAIIWKYIYNKYSCSLNR